MGYPDTAYLPLILDNISHGIFTIDEGGTITSFNRMAEQITGWCREDAIGMRCHEVFQADLCDGGCLLKRSIRTGERVEDWEVKIRRKNGHQIPISISTAALTEEDGTVRGGVEMFRDLSVERELRRQLRGSFVFEGLVSKNPAMRKVRRISSIVM